MNFSSMLNTFFIGPLKLVFEVVFQLSYQLSHNPGLSIVCLSLAMNFLVLPLYRRADRMQEQARDTEAKLHDGVVHIKKTFSGNERMMMLQTYYRQNDYSPVKSLRSSVSLLLEIPFFMAAYQFLSGLKLLQGVSFGPISDLSLPDGMISVGTVSIHFLPILMTLLNFASAALYLKGFPLKVKIRTYGIAVAFLVLLYRSPSGLVLYWSLNNLFSLIKNVCYALIKRRARRDRPRKARSKAPGKIREWIPDRRLFILTGLFLSVFIGLVIPTNYIAASPQEYVDLSNYFNPLWYAVSALLYSGGFFLLWFGVFYWLANAKGKVIFERIMLAFCGIAVVSYMFFGTHFGQVSPLLRYDGGLSFTFSQALRNFLVCLAAAAAVLLLLRRFKKQMKSVLLIAMLASATMSVFSSVRANRSLSDISVRNEQTGPHFTVSREGRNVVVLFLDRMLGEYMPYFLQEKPELKDRFDGFTYYPNTISLGGSTNIAAPALMGGYEYAPVELNRRDSEPLQDKHNEAILVMPVLFQENGYRVTVCDAPYANYQWIPDMSIFEKYPGMNTYITKGRFGNDGDTNDIRERNLRNFFCFSLMKTTPFPVQALLYDDGNYLMAGSSESLSVQIRTGPSTSYGISQAFMNPYLVLKNLSAMTKLEETGNNVLFLYNDAPHEPMLLKEPEYEPALKVDNTLYDEENKDRFTVDGRTLIVEDDRQMMHYQSDMASLLRIGEWLEYLKENGVYDNTRIIIVSDHGYDLAQMKELLYSDGGSEVDLGRFFPLLMVKDFGSRGFTVSDEFMTNADVPSLAVKDLIRDPVNPFTENVISDSEKTAHPQFICMSDDWDVSSNNGKSLKASKWLAVRNGFLSGGEPPVVIEKTVLKEHKIPQR